VWILSKVALITGGSSGLGLEMSLILASKGYDIIILARNKDRLEQAVNKISQTRACVHGYQCNITNEMSLREVYSKIYEKYKKIDFLILNAGVVSCKLLSDFKDSAELKYDLEVDLWGTILSTYVFLNLLVTGSKILMVSSGFGLMGPAGYTTYSAAKAGIINFAESLRRELLNKQISVYVTCPGDMDTPQLQEEIRQMPPWMKKETPRGMMHPSTAAEKILKKCTGKRFLIIINSEIQALIILTKLLPLRIRDAIIDRMFPIP